MPHPLRGLGAHEAGANKGSEPSSEPGAPADGVDIILHLTATRTAPPLDEVTRGAAGAGGSPATAAAAAYSQDILTVPASLAGLPALSLPLGPGADGWPVGVSLVGQWGADRAVLAIARAGVEAFGRAAMDAA